jgi:hypothetical protein
MGLWAIATPLTEVSTRAAVTKIDLRMDGMGLLLSCPEMGD